MRPDKQKVVDEIWDEARIESFLDKQPMGSEDADFSILLHAYRSMRVEDFNRFLPLYVSSGRSLDVRSCSGETLASTIEPHRHAAPFLKALRDAGAGISASSAGQ